MYVLFSSALKGAWVSIVLKVTEEFNMLVKKNFGGKCY